MKMIKQIFILSFYILLLPSNICAQSKEKANAKKVSSQHIPRMKKNTIGGTLFFIPVLGYFLFNKKLSSPYNQYSEQHSLSIPLEPNTNVDEHHLDLDGLGDDGQGSESNPDNSNQATISNYVVTKKYLTINKEPYVDGRYSEDYHKAYFNLIDPYFNHFNSKNHISDDEKTCLSAHITDENCIEHDELNIVLFTIKLEVENIEKDELNKLIDWTTINEKFPQEERDQAILARWTTPKNKND